eukprot:4301405-Heterocapsa_arctica.AAC.1
MSTLTSGLTALALSPTETAQLDRFHLQTLRILLRGDAAYQTNNWVLQRLHIPSVASFLCAQRIRWLQRIISQPDAHMLLLAVVTGRSQQSQIGALDVNYHLTPHANPWLSQWWRDMQEVAKVAPAFALEFQRLGWLATFRSDTFKKLNLRRLLRYDLLPMNEPHITRTPAASEPVSQEFRCPVVHDDMFGRVFDTQRGLTQHLHLSRGLCLCVCAVVLTYPCPF